MIQHLICGKFCLTRNTNADIRLGNSLLNYIRVTLSVTVPILKMTVDEQGKLYDFLSNSVLLCNKF